MNLRSKQNKANVFEEEDVECSSNALSTSNGSVYEVEKIVAHKVIRGQNLWKVRWVGYESCDDTWEPEENFRDNECIVKFETKRLGTISSKTKRGINAAPTTSHDYSLRSSIGDRRRCVPSTSSPVTALASAKGRRRKGSTKTTNVPIVATVPLLQAKTLLHTSRMPKELLKRETECKQIRTFLLNSIRRTSAILSAGPRVLYVSGVPGTGKTAAVFKVQNELKSKKGMPKFDFLGINALELCDARQLFIKVYNAVQKNCAETAKKRISARNAQQFLNDYFAEMQPKRRPIVILVDEVDMLYTKREDVLYTVFNWANLDHSRCSVVAISNTLDLAERKFSPRVDSRMGTNRLIFQPYEFKEIEEIIQARLNECPEVAFINTNAIELASKKVAAVSGDLRKALQLIRRGIDIALDQCEASGVAKADQQLNVQHVLDAIQQAHCSIRMEFFRALSFHELLLYRALVHVLYNSAMDGTHISVLLPHYRQLCFADETQPLPLEAVLHHMREMDSMHLVRLDADATAGQLHCRVQLGFSVSEAQFCLRLLDDERRHKEGTTTILGGQGNGGANERPNGMNE